ncbi:MAG: pilus assembly protein PilM [Candidatus Zixiibacteriota bacterium]|nr:MAG: pilus assembly protein PilM [candidate division Zixibacteria bacterium]
MNALAFLTGKSRRKGKPGADTEPARPSFSIHKIHPRQNHYLGTILSFSIDENSIQMAATRHLGKLRRILDIKKEYFPKERSSRRARQELLRNEISGFIDKHGGYGSKIALAVSGRETTFRTFLMPHLKRKELDTAIQFEVKKQIPFPIEDCIYGYRPIYRITKGGTTQYKIALHAATKRFIQEQMEPFEALGLKVSYVYHAQDVIGQFLRHLPNFDDDKNYTLLNIGLKSTEISFYKGATLEFSHATPVSSAMLGIHPEQTKYEFFAELIANEIQTSLDYYAGQYSVTAQEKIYVYGDLAYSDELLDLLNDRSGIELETMAVQRLGHLSSTNEAQTDDYPVCLAVLAGSTCQSSLPSLLPRERLAAQVEAKYSLYGRLAVAMLIVVLTLSWAMMRANLYSSEKALVELERQVNEFRNSEAYHTYNLIKREIAREQTYLEMTRQTPSYLALNLKELSHLAPSEVKLLYLDYNPELPAKNFYLHGLVRSKEIPPEVILAEFVEYLSASAFYDDVRIIRHNKKFIDELFEIDFQIQMRGVV